MAKRSTVKPSDYHLIDLMTGESHGGFVSLDAARTEARRVGLFAWQIFHGPYKVEHHDPNGIEVGGTPPPIGVPPPEHAP